MLSVKGKTKGTWWIEADGDWHRRWQFISRPHADRRKYSEMMTLKVKGYGSGFPLLENLDILKKSCSFHAWKTEWMDIMENGLKQGKQKNNKK